MSKKVLVISSSFRPDSNSHALCEEVARGVKDAGNEVEVIRLKGKKLGFCMGCYACQKLKHCVQKDDANEICRKICEADAVVFGTPVYYFCVSAQLKTILDRCVQFWPEPNGKPYYLVASEAESGHWESVEAPIHGFVDCFDGATFAGKVEAEGVYEPGSVRGTPFMQQAYDLGRKI